MIYHNFITIVFSFRGSRQEIFFKIGFFKNWAKFAGKRLSLLTANIKLHGKCRHSELLWSVFSRIRTEYGEVLRVSPYSVRMRENRDQKNSKYENFLRSVNEVKLKYPLPGLKKNPGN